MDCLTLETLERCICDKYQKKKENLGEKKEGMVVNKGEKKDVVRTLMLKLKKSSR